MEMADLVSARRLQANIFFLAVNTGLLAQPQVWARSCGTGKIFVSATGFLLPAGSVRRPDASVLRLVRWQALSQAVCDGFPPLCPALVVELASPSDQPEALRQKLASTITNGAQLGWLVLQRRRSVEIWGSGPAIQTARFSALRDASQLEAAAEFSGLVIELAQIWAA